MDMRACVGPNHMTVIRLKARAKSRRVSLAAQHYSNPLHVYCRLASMFGPNIAKKIAKTYESVIFQFTQRSPGEAILEKRPVRFAKIFKGGLGIYFLRK